MSYRVALDGPVRDVISSGTRRASELYRIERTTLNTKRAKIALFISFFYNYGVTYIIFWFHIFLRQLAGIQSVTIILATTKTWKRICGRVVDVVRGCVDEWWTL